MRDRKETKRGAKRGPDKAGGGQGQGETAREQTPKVVFGWCGIDSPVIVAPHAVCIFQRGFFRACGAEVCMVTASRGK